VNETNFNNTQYFSDYYIQNASFLRVDNISFGYNLNRLLNAKKFNAQLSLNVQNAFIVTKYQGLDPEVGGGIDNNMYPRPRIVSLGLNVNF
jgi:iron complex outermembrane receptor protein